MSLRAQIAAVSSLVFVAALAMSDGVRASEIFPANIKAYWQLPQNSSFPVPGQKGCQLCHRDDQGGTNTVTQPFGKTMQAQGLQPGDVASLYAALGYITKHSVPPAVVDSDRDGVSDFNELYYDHTNPNDPKSFVDHTPMQQPSNGGEGGESSGFEGGAGGQTSAQQPPPPAPAFVPPSAADLPPPFVHGCTLSARTSRHATGLLAFFAAAALLRRRARR